MQEQPRAVIKYIKEILMRKLFLNCMVLNLFIVVQINY